MGCNYSQRITLSKSIIAKTQTGVRENEARSGRTHAPTLQSPESFVITNPPNPSLNWEMINELVGDVSLNVPGKADDSITLPRTVPKAHVYTDFRTREFLSIMFCKSAWMGQNRWNGWTNYIVNNSATQHFLHITILITSKWLVTEWAGFSNHSAQVKVHLHVCAIHYTYWEFDA